MTTLKSPNLLTLLPIVRQLPPPRSYDGMDGVAPLQPRHLLLFLREKSKSLMHGREEFSRHHRHVLIIALRGEGKVGIDAHVFAIKAGQGILILPFQSHYYLQPLAADLAWLFITFEHPPEKRLASTRGRGALLLEETDTYHLQNLVAAWLNTRKKSDAPLHLTLILENLIRRRTKRPRRPGQEGYADVWLTRVNSLIFDHRATNFTMRNLAHWLGESVSSLRGKFHQATGTSIGRHVRHVKMRYACELLLADTLRIGEIASHCGYDTLFAFSRAFHKTIGQSPTAYRKRLLGR